MARRYPPRLLPEATSHSTLSGMIFRFIRDEPGQPATTISSEERTLMIGFSLETIDLPRMRLQVEEKLCELGALEPQQFPLTQREVVRRGATCALYFCLHGPRSVKLTAIADLKTQSMVFYGSDGVRRETIPMANLETPAA